MKHNRNIPKFSTQTIILSGGQEEIFNVLQHQQQLLIFIQTEHPQ